MVVMVLIKIFRTLVNLDW